MGNYDFEKDLKTAKKTEKEIASLIEAYLGKDAVTITFGKTKDYDILFTYAGKEWTVEIKEDFMCKTTGNVCVEYESRGKPSGVASTKAQMYFYKIHEPNGKVSIQACYIDTLKKMIEEKQYHRTVTGGDAGSYTKSYLFELSVFKRHMNELH